MHNPLFVLVSKKEHIKGKKLDQNPKYKSAPTTNTSKMETISSNQWIGAIQTSVKTDQISKEKPDINLQQDKLHNDKIAAAHSSNICSRMYAFFHDISVNI